ncbi:nucleotide pyrophosphohydrolase [Candidatus Woesearchaeota archaeon]|nr:nucleotide pyrophosphohydrolase [Candidatus Woesearchaeota archaeon]
MDLKTMQEKQREQAARKDRLPKDMAEVVLHLVEEVGEVCEAIREGQPREYFEAEVADVLWQLNKLCWMNGFDLERAFLAKLEKKERG